MHYRACNLCEASCGLEITVESNRVVEIRGDAADPFSQGYLCPKGVALQDLTHDPDRLRRPVRREGDRWVEMSWTEAFDLVAERLLATRARHGGDAIGFYLGNPITHGWAPIIYIPQLLKAIGTRNRYSAASVDQQPQHLLSHLLFGSPLLLPVPDVDRTDFLLVVGGNPLVSNGSIMTAPNIKRRLERLRQRGGRLVVVDPRRTETADAADEHIFIRPGTDAFLLAAMAHVIVDEGLARPGRAEGYVDGLDAVADLVRQVTPEDAERRTGVPADTIRGLARGFAAARRAAVYGRLGVCQTEFGTTAYWLIHVLNVLTGRLDEVGGWMLAEPAFDLPRIGRLTTDLPGYDRWRSRVRGIPEVAAEFPSSTLADEILTPGEGQIRAMVLVAGNPVLTVPQGRRIDEALASLDFCVAVDYYINESTRHADVILPPTTALEREEFDLVFPAVSVRNHVRYGERVIEPVLRAAGEPARTRGPPGDERQHGHLRRPGHHPDRVRGLPRGQGPGRGALRRDRRLGVLGLRRSGDPRQHRRVHQDHQSRRRGDRRCQARQGHHHSQPGRPADDHARHHLLRDPGRLRPRRDHPVDPRCGRRSPDLRARLPVAQ